MSFDGVGFSHLFIDFRFWHRECLIKDFGFGWFLGDFERFLEMGFAYTNFRFPLRI
ncbi:hypothetical protein RchiOBHm_Chr2g0085021 [Rosa chinensis]|uniref:Uncharacterized protein n=1 Tax=Rosa chinensis TaxID=74649 RepID=A0A2P6RI02_ROSCH|nr:hypothetical protein RchiOBHm_Chr2g0085021 [Rosa chinensis]